MLSGVVTTPTSGGSPSAVLPTRMVPRTYSTTTILQRPALRRPLSESVLLTAHAPPQPTTSSTDAPCCVSFCLWIGSRETEACLPALQRAGITHILQAGGELRPSHPGRFRYKHLSLGDDEEEDLVSVFDDAFTFIDEGRKAGVLRLHLHLHLQQQQQ